MHEKKPCSAGKPETRAEDYTQFFSHAYENRTARLLPPRRGKVGMGV